jgi:hypothetical protein
MNKCLGTLLLLVAIMGAASSIGCSGKREDKPAPEIPKDVLKNVPTKGTSAPKPSPPPP